MAPPMKPASRLSAKATDAVAHQSGAGKQSASVKAKHIAACTREAEVSGVVRPRLRLVETEDFGIAGQDIADGVGQPLSTTITSNSSRGSVWTKASRQSASLAASL